MPCGDYVLVLVHVHVLVLGGNAIVESAGVIAPGRLNTPTRT